MDYFIGLMAKKFFRKDIIPVKIDIFTTHILTRNISIFCKMFSIVLFMHFNITF